MKFRQYPEITTIGATDAILVSQLSPAASKFIQSSNFLKALLSLAPASDLRNLLLAAGFIGVSIQGSQVKPLLALQGDTVAPYPKALLNIDRTFSDDIFPTSDKRLGIALNILASGGGTYNDSGAHPNAGNTSHIGINMVGRGSTPTQLIFMGCDLIQYGRGDAGAIGGTSTVYGQGLARGTEYNTIIGNLQAQAVLSSGSSGAMTLNYSSATNSATFGVGRILIDIDIAYSTGTVSVTRASSTVTGSGVNWDSSLIGQYFRLTADNRTLGGVTGGAWYKITAVPTSTTLTLEEAYGNVDATGGAYSISPGAEVTAFDTTAKTITVVANSIAWASGNRVQMRIHMFSPVATYVGAAGVPFPRLGGPAAIFQADHSAGYETERLGAGFGMGGGPFVAGFYLGGSSTDLETGIRGGEATISGNHFMTIPRNKRITWGSTTPWSDTSSPSIVADSNNDINFMRENVVKGAFKAGGGLYARNTDGTTNLLELHKAGDVFAAGFDPTGRIMVPTVTSTPIDTPTTTTMVYDTVSHQLKIYDGGWRHIDATL